MTMDKICVICGAVFQAPPSSKKVTCSPECRSKRAAHAAKKGHKWSEAAKKKRSDEKAADGSFESVRIKGSAAAMELPEGQRGPQNRESKIWILIDPCGNHVPVVNLIDWARENYTLFEPPCDDVDKAAIRVSSGFKAIASSMRGVKSRQRPVTSYKGWGLAKIPIKRKGEHGNDA